MTYITLPSVPILEKASESPLNILDLIRGKILRNKIDDDHRLFLQGYSAIQIIKAASLKVCSLPDNRRHPVACGCLVLIMLGVCGPQIPLQVVSDQLHLVWDVAKMLDRAHIWRGGPEDDSEMRMMSAEQSQSLPWIQLEANSQSPVLRIQPDR